MQTMAGGGSVARSTEALPDILTDWTTTNGKGF
jgi:hypothetical protein